MNRAAGAAGPSWRVVQVTDGSGQDSSGRYVSGKTVTYQLQSGHTGTVFIPATTFSADAVRAAVAAEAATLDQVANLTSDG